MKWFEVDSDTPNDWRIRAVRAKFGNAGLGALFALWCFVADQGRRRIGWSLDGAGKPIPKQFLVEASGLNDADFDLLVAELTRNGHVSEKSWNNRRVLVFPAMSKRADTYTRRRLRRVFEQRSKSVRVQHNTTQHNTTSTKYSAAKTRGTKSNALRAKSTPKKTKNNYRVLLKLAHEAIARDTDHSIANLKEIVKGRCSTLKISYDPELIGNAIEAALHHGKRAHV